MQVVLVMFRADDQRRSFALPRQITVIGRREDCDLRIPLGDVSRKHCRLIQMAMSCNLKTWAAAMEPITMVSAFRKR